MVQVTIPHRSTSVVTTGHRRDKTVPITRADHLTIERPWWEFLRDLWIRVGQFEDIIVQEVLDGADITAATIAVGDKVLFQDISDSDNLKQDTAEDLLKEVVQNSTLTAVAPAGADQVLIRDNSDSSALKTVTATALVALGGGGGGSGKTLIAERLAGDKATNGTFASDTSWTKGTGWTIAAGVASSDGTQAGDSDLEQAASLIDEQQYEVTFTVSNYSSGNVVPACGGTEGTDRAANGTFIEVITAGSDGKIVIRADSTFVGDIDDVIVNTDSVVFLGAAAVIDGTYDKYLLECIGVQPENDDQDLELTVYSTSWKTANYNYASSRHESGGGTGDNQDVSRDAIPLTNGTNSLGVGNAAAESASIDVKIMQPADTALYKHVSWIGAWNVADGNVAHVEGVAQWQGGTGAITGLALEFQDNGGGSDGYIKLGTFRLWGLPTS